MKNPKWHVLCGDARRLEGVRDGSVHCILTSVPYFGLRRYIDDPREIGRERTLDEWVANLVECAREWRRALRDDGTLWVNIGDSYAANRPGGQPPPTNTGNRPAYLAAEGQGDVRTPAGLKPKDLIGLPWTLAFALRDDGWWLRSTICWVKGCDWLSGEREAQEDIRRCLDIVRQEAKGSLFGLSKSLAWALKRAEKAVDRLVMSGSVMPESVTSRPTTAYEMLFMFSKSSQYYFDQEAIRVASTTNDPRKPYGSNGAWELDGRSKWEEGAGQPQDRDASKRNPRNAWVWRIGTSPQGTFLLSDGEEVSHFSAFPQQLAEHVIKCATSEAGVCTSCGAPWVRVVRRESMIIARSDRQAKMGQFGLTQPSGTMIRPPTSETVGWVPTCVCHGEPIPGPMTCKKCGGSGQKTMWSQNELRAEFTSRTGRTDGKFTADGTTLGARHKVNLGEPCPACLCPDCGGKGKKRTSTPRQAEHFPESDQRESGKRGTIANVGQNSMTYTGEPCPTCQGVGATGQIEGDIWLTAEDLELIQTPTGVQAGDDPTIETGRRGYNRPRGENEGTRPMTRYEQKQYALQLRISPHREKMELMAQSAFAHYIRTDKSGARPPPPELLETWIRWGWIKRVEPPTLSTKALENWPKVPATVLDPMAGSGVTGRAALSLERSVILNDLKPQYAQLCRERMEAWPDDVPQKRTSKQTSDEPESESSQLEMEW